MRHLLIVILALLPSMAFCQLGVSFHQSNLPFIGFNYELKGKLRPELRIGTDTYFEDITIEGILTYDFLKTTDYEFYGGIGGRVNENTGGLVIPVGLNIYPLPVKRFGFHIELAPIIEEDVILRGSWGIRYRFRKNE